MNLVIQKFKSGFDFPPHFTAKLTERAPHQEGFIWEIYELGDGPTDAPVDPEARLISWWFSAPLQHDDITGWSGSGGF